MGKEAVENPATHWDEEKEKEYLEQLKKERAKKNDLQLLVNTMVF